MASLRPVLNAVSYQFFVGDKGAYHVGITLCSSRKRTSKVCKARKLVQVVTWGDIDYGGDCSRVQDWYIMIIVRIGYRVKG